MQVLLTLLIPVLFYLAGYHYSENRATGAETFSIPAPGYPDSVKVGDAAPMFVLRDLTTDNAVYLRDYTGKVLRDSAKPRQVVVLSFWSTWCQPCKEEIPRLTKLAGEFKGRPVRFFLISTMESQSTTDDSIRALYKARSYTLQCLLDATDRIGMRYNARVLPLLVVIDKQGVIRKIMRGFHEEMYSDFAGFLQKLAN